MFLFLLLLIVLFVLPFLNFLIWFPSFFSVKDNVTIGIHAVGYFGETVVSTTGAKFNLVFINVVLFPAQVTFPNKPSDWGDDSPIKSDQFNSYVSGDVLNGKISTDKSNGELVLRILLFLGFKNVLGILLLFGFVEDSVDLSHFLVVVNGSNPALFFIDITVFILLLSLCVSRHCNPSFLIIQSLFSLRTFLIVLILTLLLIDWLLFFLNDFLHNWKWLLSQLLWKTFIDVHCMG